MRLVSTWNRMRVPRLDSMVMVIDSMVVSPPLAPSRLKVPIHLTGEGPDVKRERGGTEHAGAGDAATRAGASRGAALRGGASCWSGWSAPAAAPRCGSRSSARCAARGGLHLRALADGGQVRLAAVNRDLGVRSHLDDLVKIPNGPDETRSIPVAVSTFFTVPSTMPTVAGRLISVLWGLGVGVGVVGGTWAHAPPTVRVVSAATTIVVRT